MNEQQEQPIKMQFVPIEELPEDHFIRQVAEELPMLFNELGENI